MKNLNNKKMLETINKVVIVQYIKNLKDLKTESLTLYKSFPYTGAPNISEPIELTVFTNLETILSSKYNLCKN